jgi:hypothetical protein
VATFDATIHFYSLRPGQAQPHMLVVPDITDVYCPLPGNVVVGLQQSKDLVGCAGWEMPRKHVLGAARLAAALLCFTDPLCLESTLS